MGSGGAIDSNKNFVKASQIFTAFGEKYDFDEKAADIIDETVIYVPIIPKHWGHFLIDVVCKFWFLPEYKDKYKIAYCSWNWGGKPVGGNYLEFLKLLGVNENMLINITEPTGFKKILIPSPAFGFCIDYNKEYSDIIKTAVENTLKSDEVKNLKKYEKIYFTRTQFEGARKTEIGEKSIEHLFEKNGFHIMAPEKLSAMEQIFYINSCKEMVSLSGTAAHNAMFLSEEGSLTVLNRTCLTNPPQLRINQLFNINCTYVDVYNKWIEKHPRTYGGKDGKPLWVEVNDNLLSYFNDRKLDASSYNNIRSKAAKLTDKAHFFLVWIYISLKKKIKR